MTVPAVRVRVLNDDAIRAERSYVLYWMVAFRRPRWNFALQHAVHLANTLGKPLIVLEALRVGYPWASERIHGFVLDGMRDNQAHFAAGGNALYYPYIEPEQGAGSGLLAALANDACVVVSDDYPGFFIPRMHAATAPSLSARLEVVDSNGMLPLRATDRVFTRAHSFRRFLQKTLSEHLVALPEEEPLRQLTQAAAKLPSAVASRWPQASSTTLSKHTLATLPIDHGIATTELVGGFRSGESAMRAFLDGPFPRYAEERNHPDAPVSSGLSPWLHFGHVSTHHVFDEIAKNEGWSTAELAPKPNGSREGWWGMSAHAEAFLDELVTWREVGFNAAAHLPGYDRYESLPEWARVTLEEHAGDAREYIYTLSQFETAATHDPIWNAAQVELVETGRMQNYLRMLWGKKILEWTRSPREALAIMVELNNKYALDGRDPNSYSGIFWVLGRYDRAWGPERPIFGKIRYMSSENTKRKLRMREYLARFG